MSPSTAQDGQSEIPVLLLKTKSTPGDAYEELFSVPQDGLVFAPRFVPVLEHRFESQGINEVKELLHNRRIGRNQPASYGGLIFTSQRAVEAFASVVEQGSTSSASTAGWPHLQDVPIYSVGPATTRALRAISQEPPLSIFGEHTGNGEQLAQFILEHYGDWYRDWLEKPPLLFLVGEQRRDIIPRTLMDESLPAHVKIRVDEKVVYGTGVMETFGQDLNAILAETTSKAMRWVVVFSPTGCDVMLAGLGLLDKSTGKAVDRKSRGDKCRVATIGPTTRDYLQRTFGFEPDVCAATPSPEGVCKGIIDFMAKLERG